MKILLTFHMRDDIIIERVEIEAQKTEYAEVSELADEQD